MRQLVPSMLDGSEIRRQRWPGHWDSVVSLQELNRGIGQSEGGHCPVGTPVAMDGVETEAPLAIEACRAWLQVL